MAIRYDKKFNSEINRIVKNYNQKITRLERKDTDYHLPEKITVKQIKALAKTRKDVRNKLAELQRFSSRGAEETIVTSGGYAISLYKYKETKRKLTNTKRKLTREINRMSQEYPTFYGEKQPFTFGQLGDEYLINLQTKRQALNKTIQTLNPQQFKRLQQLISKINTVSNEKMQIFKDNYIQMLEDINNFYGEDTSDIIIQLENLSPEQFYKMYNNEKSIQALQDYYYMTFISNKYSKQVYNQQQQEVSNIISGINDNISNILKDYA